MPPPSVVSKTPAPPLRPAELTMEQSATLLAAAQLIGNSSDPHATIAGMLQLLSDHLGLEKARVLLPDPASGALHISHSCGLTSQEIAQAVYQPGEGVTGRVMSSGEYAVIPDIHNEPRYLGRLSALAAADLPAAYIAVPILLKDAPIGVLAAQRARLQSATDLSMLQIFAAMIGQLLHIDRLSHDNTAPPQDMEDHPVSRSPVEDGEVHGIVGRSPALRNALAAAAKAAATRATVMLIGESGCGKERFARMIHLASERRDQPFVCINCAAIPPQLLEAELFGHEKGSFTGATATRKGKFEIAAGGTLFLDEIGDMAPDLQAKLLRVLQEKTIQRVGSNHDIAVDVRIISATNKQLEGAVKAGDFRLDLYYRLNVLRIQLPPLRERHGDIKLLALYFLARYNQQQYRNVVFTQQALQRLDHYDWPGNVRQLENVIERLVIMTDSELITDSDIDQLLKTEIDVTIDELGDDAGFGAEPSGESFRPYRKVNSDERSRIIAALRQAGGNKTQAARLLDMSSRQLHYRLAKLKIEV
ncbi:MAG: sigma 54-interacting transcriptional regulator [Gammaproteobacteria bacterium]|nr:sigma 54-interacting transcriptional regulator [Gammaproteobacteria bacterium]